MMREDRAAMTLLFEGFTPGRDFGEAVLALDERLIRRWVKLYPQDAECLPAVPEGMLSVVVMRAYIDRCGPRPPGNVHTSQGFQVHRMPKAGDTVRTRMTCAGAELKKGRGWVTIASESRDAAGTLLFTGEMRLIWAA